MRGVTKILIATFILGILGFALFRIYADYAALANLRFEVYSVDVDIRWGGIWLFKYPVGADIKLYLKFYNPTPYDTPVFYVEFDCYLAGSYLGHGSLPKTWVPAGQTRFQTITFTISLVDAAKAFVNALLRGEYRVTVRGTIYANILWGTIPYSTPFEGKL